MMGRVADTSVLYALFDADDKHPEEAREDISEPMPITVPPEILVETVNLVEYRTSWSLANRASESLLERPHISVSEPVPMDGVLEVFDRGEGQLSLADAILVQTWRVHGREPLAYDSEIVQALD